MKILVTGGAGFIGANFLRLMVPRHSQWQFLNLDKLTYAGNLMSLSSLASCSNYRFSQVDLCDAAAVKETIDTFLPDVVIHFAAESHVDRSIHGPKAFVETNVIGTFNLLEAIRGSHKKDMLVHHVSTDEVYGSLGPEGLFSESTAYDPSSPYSATKAASDHLMRAYGRTFGLRIRVSNCSNNYGPYQFPEKLIPLMILNAKEGKPLPIYGKGLNVRDWLYVEDHCEAILRIVQQGKDGETYNIGGNSEQTNLAVVDRICLTVAEKTKQPHDTVLALKTYVQDRPGHDMRYAIDASKIRSSLGWEPKENFESGLQKTVSWYFENMDWVAAVRSGEYKQWMSNNYDKR